MRYRPLLSVTAVRTFSIRAGLAASTVTPGSTAPEVSRTSPATVACAHAAAGSITDRVTPNRVSTTRRISMPPWFSEIPRVLRRPRPLTRGAQASSGEVPFAWTTAHYPSGHSRCQVTDYSRDNGAENGAESGRTPGRRGRSEEHTSELQSQSNL